MVTFFPDHSLPSLILHLLFLSFLALIRDLLLVACIRRRLLFSGQQICFINPEMRLLGWHTLDQYARIYVYTLYLLHEDTYVYTAQNKQFACSFSFHPLHVFVCVHHHSKSLKFSLPSHTHSQPNSTINNPRSKGNSMKVKLYVFLYTFIFLPLWSVVVILLMKNTLR